MSEAILEVLERNDHTVKVTVKNLEPTPEYPSGSPFNLTDYALEFYVKESPSSPDGVPLYTVANGAIVVDNPATLGTLSIQMSASDLQPNRRWYKLDAVKAGRRLTLGYGLLRIKDV